MKKRIKTIAGAALIAILAAGSSMTAMAEVKGIGQWCEGLPDGSKPALTNLENGNAETNWWFIESPDGVTVDSKNCAANTWLWISGKCYYFDADGWMVKAKDGNPGQITDHTGAAYWVDADGAWTDENGVLMTNTGNQEEWTAVETLIGNAGAQASGSSSENTSGSSADTTDERLKNPTGVPAGENVATSKGKTTTSGGEKPDDSDHSNNTYQLGTKNGSTISNSWANYSVDLSGWTSTMPEGNTDTIATDTDGNIISIWFDNLGSRSLDTFVNSRVDGKSAGTEEIAGATFNKYEDTIPDPSGTITNYNYVRQIGNAVMVIETQGNASKIAGVISSMRAAN